MNTVDRSEPVSDASNTNAEVLAAFSSLQNALSDFDLAKRVSAGVSIALAILSTSAQ